ncbi:hypothetical protein LCGC14_2844020 [marine sediment metagenome]|uniref:Uncharacterized protein n=1 Tax=marine sediment metagenome TaxID=412755 RepID=A0A0F8YAI9_9ZZZZ
MRSARNEPGRNSFATLAQKAVLLASAIVALVAVLVGNIAVPIPRPLSPSKVTTLSPPLTPATGAPVHTVASLPRPEVSVQVDLREDQAEILEVLRMQFLALGVVAAFGDSLPMPDDVLVVGQQQVVRQFRPVKE